MRDVLVIQLALRWGVVLGLLSIILNTVIYLFSLYEFLGLNFLLLSSLFIGVIYFSFVDFRAVRGIQIRTNQAIWLGFLLFLMAGLITGSYDAIYKKFLDPSMVDKQVQIFITRYETMGLSPDLVSRISSSSRVWMLGRLGLLSVTFFYLILGMFFTLLMSTFSRKD